ncbi:hypothetical protein EMIHUDRAFT_214579 [Emiliania huxleyi CCMP1516]|uniref:Phosphatidylinositol-3,4,5-trisphosphate 3-phosphatase n=2 Tax=Emiliania huxleyi TaxID=2903 RepID=A0A0D3IJ58_EMIH1|nr:hypothetical protein EMIHUDRAFT_214579 [Emiliania huxleyi CCMP1516]EOD11293.1 hypothetical protein EMIHUDRAFT_214579 [Emiliania huxleyi CCMP1516]|eukprot:XP_005763722.1 hypothetical protein EMIHUDRAFT_214579 [Emiliania huxleyi CCMP1516]
MMHDFCASVAAWHDEHPDNVAVVHCKAGKGRTGTMISAALSLDALAFYGFARTNNCEGVTIASQRLYVHYYARLCREPAACERLLDRQAACRLVRLIGTRPDVPVVDVNTKSCPLLLSSDVRVEVSHRVSGQMHDDKLFSFWFNAAMLSKQLLSHLPLAACARRATSATRPVSPFLDFARLLDRDVAMFAQPT